MSKRSKSTKPFPVANLKWLMDSKKLWLNPEYQREAVWTRSQNQLLIDSLFAEIDIPKIYFREIDRGTFEYEVVDGQQRLRAISAFFDDEFKMPQDADDVDGNPIRSRVFSELDTDLQMRFRNVALDVVVLTGYSDDDIEEIFLRMQNGTPLNAPEKRRAIPGNMRNVVESLSRHRVFELCGFANKRFAWEDAVAKALHLLLAGTITDIRASSIKRTYRQNESIALTTKEVRRLKTAYNFMYAAFKGKQNPAFKKYSLITLPYLVAEMLDTYDLSQHGGEFAEALLDFEQERVENSELAEEKQNSALAAYTNAARSDSIQDLRYRHEFLHEYLVGRIVTLAVKDPTRSFSKEQRTAIYRRDRGTCQICGALCEETEFHADHKKAHSRGGKTTVENGQVLCNTCNLRKGAA